MAEGGVIASDFCRHPIEPLNPILKQRLLSLLHPLEPLVLNWGK